MNAHELAYCRYLLDEIRQLCIANEAMSTLLDNPSFSRKEWRATSDAMSQDLVFQSSVAANFGPYFDRLKRALQDEKILTQLQQPAS
ncbi:MAG TPA: hypothetical protein VHM25_21045 [Polyangiaceae bacterium]|nr:hypothetical protein [Polyangiaceae bacterium]